MQQSRLAYLFSRYINKECTTSEKAELFQIFQTGDHDAELKVLLDQMVDEEEAKLKLPEAVGNEMLQSIIAKNRGVKTEISPITPKRSVRFVWRSIAAASVALLGLVLYFMLLQPTTVNAVDQSTDIGVTNDWLCISTAVGERKRIQLPDGTEVWLSPSSSLEYPQTFNGNTREINLSGEAFFEVKSDAQHPFIIHSGSIETKVLGTSFNIQAYENQEQIAVMVVTGKVHVRNTTQPANVELVANERAVFHRQTTQLTKVSADKIDAPNMLKRKEGMFVYRDERLQKLIDDLQEYFGIDIHVADAMKDCKVNANFYLTDHLDEILEPVAIMVNGDLTSKNKEFAINGKGCP